MARDRGEGKTESHELKLGSARMGLGASRRPRICKQIGWDVDSIEESNARVLGFKELLGNFEWKLLAQMESADLLRNSRKSRIS